MTILRWRVELFWNLRMSKLTQLHLLKIVLRQIGRTPRRLVNFEQGRVTVLTLGLLVLVVDLGDHRPLVDRRQRRAHILRLVGTSFDLVFASLTRSRKATAKHFVQNVIVVDTLVVEVFIGALRAFQLLSMALLQRCSQSFSVCASATFLIAVILIFWDLDSQATWRRPAWRPAQFEGETGRQSLLLELLLRGRHRTSCQAKRHSLRSRKLLQATTRLLQACQANEQPVVLFQPWRAPQLLILVILIYLLSCKIQILHLHRSILLRRRLLSDLVHLLSDDLRHIGGSNDLIQICGICFWTRVCSRIASHFRRIFRVLHLRQVLDEHSAYVGAKRGIIIEHNRALGVFGLMVRHELFEVI